MLVTGWGGFYLGSMQSGISSVQRGLLETLLGIGLVSAGAGALNEALERRIDARMKRTADRPMAAGRFSLAQGVLAGLAALAFGAANASTRRRFGVLWTQRPALPRRSVSNPATRPPPKRQVRRKKWLAKERPRNRSMTRNQPPTREPSSALGNGHVKTRDETQRTLQPRGALGMDPKENGPPEILLAVSLPC